MIVGVGSAILSLDMFEKGGLGFGFRGIWGALFGWGDWPLEIRLEALREGRKARLLPVRFCLSLLHLLPAYTAITIGDITSPGIANGGSVGVVAAILSLCVYFEKGSLGFSFRGGALFG
jgi:hypothetical protein